MNDISDIGGLWGGDWGFIPPGKARERPPLDGNLKECPHLEKNREHFPPPIYDLNLK